MAHIAEGMNPQTFNFAVLMIGFMAILWVVKVFVRLRKLLRLHHALTKTVVIRMDGRVQDSQHLDAISLSHLRQILNNHLAHTTTVMKEVNPRVHLEPESLKLRLCSEKGNVHYTLNFTVSCEKRSECEVYYGVTRDAVRACSTHADLKGAGSSELSRSLSPTNQSHQRHHLADIFSREDYLQRTKQILSPGEDMKVSLTVPPNMMLEVEPDDEKRYFAVIKLAQESKVSEYGSKQRPDFQITMVKLTTDGLEQNQFAELDQQLVGGGGMTYEVKEIFGTEEEGECLICLTDPRDTILLPCRHLCICRDCLLRMVTAKCPICRSTISSHISLKPAAVAHQRAQNLEIDSKD